MPKMEHKRRAGKRFTLGFTEMKYSMDFCSNPLNKTVSEREERQMFPIGRLLQWAGISPVEGGVQALDGLALDRLLRSDVLEVHGVFILSSEFRLLNFGLTLNILWSGFCIWIFDVLFALNLTLQIQTVKFKALIFIHWLFKGKFYFFLGEKKEKPAREKFSRKFQNKNPKM